MSSSLPPPSRYGNYKCVPVSMKLARNRTFTLKSLLLRWISLIASASCYVWQQLKENKFAFWMFTMRSKPLSNVMPPVAPTICCRRSLPNTYVFINLIIQNLQSFQLIPSRLSSRTSVPCRDRNVPVDSGAISSRVPLKILVSTAASLIMLSSHRKSRHQSSFVLLTRIIVFVFAMIVPSSFI
jgi:hypothetical protein